MLAHSYALLFLSLSLAASASAQHPDPSQTGLRPPAVPLIACDPYFSIWSVTDTLPAEWTKHWTGATQALEGLVRIDGTPFRIMGKEPASVPPMPQRSVRVTPTQTVYEFDGAGIQIVLTFMTPMLARDLDLLSRPVAYLTWDVRSLDGGAHRVLLYYDNSAELVVNTPDQKVEWSRMNLDSLTVLRMGSSDQRILGRSGDDLRIDWGYLYLAAPREASCVLTDHRSARESFARTGMIPRSDDFRMPRAAEDDWPVMAVSLDLGTVADSVVSRHIVLAYDDLYGIEYFGRRLPAYWRRKGDGAEELLRWSTAEYESLRRRCAAFDAELTEDLRRCGGDHFADLAVLAYRQCLAAQKLAADMDGTPLLFPKENFSNGCISTVDVLYPACPLLLFLNPKLMEASLTPVLEYARSPRWPHPFAPHDLGTYPLANGQVYGGGEKTAENQMPVEECGNMILMVAALAKCEGNASYAEKYWPSLSRWAAYLLEKGLDPENQLCTDDFAGHLAHNTNLSIKAILALGGYAMLCDMTGKKQEGSRYHRAAAEYARKWVTMADDGDHYRLAFDMPGTWSQKYNLVWDRILGLHLFPPSVAQKEIAFYLHKQNAFGLPLDNRKEWTKLDWSVWTATLAADDTTFVDLMEPAYNFCNRSPSRVPLTDWYWTTDGKQVGFQARSVVGGVFIKALADDQLWHKWRTGRGAGEERYSPAREGAKE